MAEITKRQRLEAVFTGHKPDRTPTIGGWIYCPEHICALAGVTLDDYWASPREHSIRAYEKLGCDGLIDIGVPATREDFRIVTPDSFRRADSGRMLEDCIAQIDAMPAPQDIEASFDLNAEYAAFKRHMLASQNAIGEMVWMPAHWANTACLSWYGQFGYENYFMLVALHPQRIARAIQVSAAQAHCRNRVIARAVTEGIFPHALLCGEDICTQRGPMISPDFIAENYAQPLRHSLQPLVDVGCKPVWHCDGDVRPIMDVLLANNVKGLQGFQPECGLTMEYISSLRTSDGEKLVIFGPVAVTTELPVLSPAGVRDLVRRAIDIFADTAHLALFTANTINPDCPLENIVAMYEAVKG